MSGQSNPPWAPGPHEDGSELWAWVRSLEANAGGAEPGTAKFCKASVRHASRSGVCVVLSWRPEVQELVHIEMLGSSPKAAHPQLARVTHTRPSSRGGWVTACAYAAPAETDVQGATSAEQPAPRAGRP